jgi:hypothetical protein
MPRPRADKLRKPSNLWEVLQGPEGGFDSFPLHTALWAYKKYMNGKTGRFGHLPGVYAIDAHTLRRREEGHPDSRTGNWLNMAWLLCKPSYYDWTNIVYSPGRDAGFIFSETRGDSFLPGYAFFYEREGVSPSFLAKEWLEVAPWPIPEGGIPASLAGFESPSSSPGKTLYPVIRLLRDLTLESLFYSLEMALLEDDPKRIKAALEYTKACFNPKAILSLRTPKGWLISKQRGRPTKTRAQYHGYRLPYFGLPLFNVRPLKEEATRLLRKAALASGGVVPEVGPIMAQEDWRWLTNASRKASEDDAVFDWIAHLYGVPMWAIKGLLNPSALKRSLASRPKRQVGGK